MARTEAQIDDFVAALAEQEWRNLDAHPEAELLVAYQAGELGEAEEDEIRAHLGICPQCVDTVLALEVFTDEEAGREFEAERDAEQRAEDWAAIEARLHASQPAKASNSAEPSVDDGARVVPLPKRHQPNASRWQALAAGLGVLCLGLSLWLATVLTSPSGNGLTTPQTLATPQTNVHAVNLRTVEQEALTGSRGDGDVRIPVGTEHLLFFLDGVEPERFPDYALEVHTSDGALVWRREGVQRAAEGNFTVLLPRTFLAAGSYRLQVLGLGEGDPVALGSYRVDIDEVPSAQ